MQHNCQEIVQRLILKGVRIACPSGVEIGPDVDPDRISGERVIIHNGCRLHGAETLLSPGVELGYEAPVTLHNCQLGEGVKLQGGFFRDSCFLDGASMGSSAQVRETCLLEEHSKGAHCVGLKQTILFPFVTLGSLVNFCDCLMAGGTDERNHSEVGSGYVHFNYTPNQDKATASLIGDVPRGVMLNQRPIFLGGQGGLVGPIRIAYGTVLAAGNVIRQDTLDEGTLILGERSLARSLPFTPGRYGQVKRIVSLNCIYIGNLAALRQWYLAVRSLFIQPGFMTALHAGAVKKIDAALQERIKRLGQVAEKLPASIAMLKEGGGAPSMAFHHQEELLARWPVVKEVIQGAILDQGVEDLREDFLSAVAEAITVHGRDYTRVIARLDKPAAAKGTLWLQGIVNRLTDRVQQELPVINAQRS